VTPRSPAVRPTGRSRRFPLLALVGVAALAATGAAVSACGSAASGNSVIPDVPITDPYPSYTGGGSPVTHTPPGPADLLIELDDGEPLEWTLTCEPIGGTHPDPEIACEVLGDVGATAFPAVPKDMACTEVFGGDQTARITGVWRGLEIDVALSRTNGCEISRWDALLGLLPETPW
jgi:hypothetical protein